MIVLEIIINFGKTIFMMASSSPSNESNLSTTKWPPSKALEWSLVELLKPPFKRGGTWELKCKFCEKEMKVTSVTRLREHFINEKSKALCLKVPKGIVDELQLELTRTLSSRKRTLDMRSEIKGENSEATSADTHLQSKAWQKEDVDKAVGQFFYGCGIAFNVARSRYFTDMVEAIGSYGRAYKPHGSHTLRTKLLTNIKDDLIEELKPVRDAWVSNGCTITSDGWSNTRNMPLLNVLSISIHGAYFLKSIDASGFEKTGEYIAQHLTAAINEVGAENVVQVITDNGSNCKSARQKVEQTFPHITSSGCAAHGIDLALEDIGKLEWVSCHIARAKSLIRFITSHQKSQALFRQLSKEEKGLELLRAGDTRFGTHFIMLERLMEVQGPLQRMVVSQDWESWSGSGLAEKNNVKLILLDIEFWKAIEFLVKITKPIFYLLRFVDSGKPTMGKFYGKMQHVINAINALQDIDGEKKSNVIDILEKRWRFMLSPLHCAGYVLDPEYRGRGQENMGEVMLGFTTIRNKIFPKQEDQVLVELQLASYRNREGLFSDPISTLLAKELSGHAWWTRYGVATPQLQALAVKVLSQVTVASACERSWSTFEFVHNKLRNRLTVERATDLVFVFSSLRLKDKVFDPDYKEEVIQWFDGEEADEEDDVLM